MPPLKLCSSDIAGSYCSHGSSMYHTVAFTYWQTHFLDLELRKTECYKTPTLPILKTGFGAVFS
jgi:hypothetical protein